MTANPEDVQKPQHVNESQKNQQGKKKKKPVILPGLCVVTGMHNGNKTGDEHTMYTEPHSCNHCCSGKAANITYSERVFVTLGVHYAFHMHHTVTCGLSNSTIFFTHYLINDMIFEKSY